MAFLEACRETKVRKLDVSLTIDKNVIGFDVSVYKAQCMHSFYSQDTFRDIETSYILAE